MNKCPVCQNETDQNLCPVCGYDLEHDYIIHNLFSFLDEDEIEAYQKKIDKLKEINESKQKNIVHKDDQTVLFQLHSFSETIKIADALKLHNNLLVSLENISRDESQRVIDFLTGCVYMEGGTMSRIGSWMFAITAAGVIVDSTFDEELNDLLEGK